MRVAVAISGGVDSAYALYKLKDAGHDVTAFHLLMGDWNDPKEAEEVARVLGVDLEVIDIREEFERRVLEYFFKEYESGRTPNPCYVCNREVKFGIFLKIALEMGFDAVASGHYARVRNGYLYRARDRKKDQSYFLSSLRKDQLEKVIFPLGEVEKEFVKREMERMGIRRSSESQDVCFLKGKNLGDFLKARFGIMKGVFMDETGQILGEHQGYYRFTIGQRRGLGVSAGKRLYVKGIDPERNVVVLGDRESVMFGSMVVTDLNVLAGLPDTCQVKIRSNFKPVDCSVKVENGKAFVVFHEKTFAVTPGQVAVFYDGDLVLASGIIESAG